jgi:hypothetical protein
MAANLYRVMHLNRPVKRFSDRDEAVAFILQRCERLGHAYGDYEILDNSDGER